MPDYEEFRVRTYQFWSVFIHESQYFLGRTYIWCNREVVDLMDITDEERAEFFSIGRDLKLALGELFQPDLMNWASLGNLTSHCHVHVIPRYEKPRSFAGIEFTDERWGKNYAPYNYDFKIPKEKLLEIRDALKKKLSRQ